MREELSGVLDTMRDISQGEKQRRKTEGERPEEVAWAQSARNHDAALREQRLWEWLTHYEEQIRRHTANYEALLARYRAGIERCERELGIDENDDGKAAA